MIGLLWLNGSVLVVSNDNFAAVPRKMPLSTSDGHLFALPSVQCGATGGH